MPKIRNIYLLLFSLYWAQGLPVGFMTHALPVILRAQGVSLAHIGGFGLLMLPWSIKIFWAPWVDRFGHSAYGHYRSWIIPTQFLSILTLIILSFLPIATLNEPKYLLAFFVRKFWLASQATQDNSTAHLPQFTGVIRHTYAHSVTSYGGVTLQNKRKPICRAVSTKTESEPRHPMIFHSVVLTQNLVGGYHA